MKLFRPLLGFIGMLALLNATAPAKETVVLLHGLGRTNRSMLRLAAALRHEGYAIVNVSYPSRLLPLEELAAEWLPAQLAAIPPDARVHFVTHSLGGILVRLWLQECGAPPRLGRVVMLAPPNAGSEIADRLARFAPYRWATGPNGQHLGTGANALPHALGAWPAKAAELGVIAGAWSGNPLLGAMLSRPHDGKVSVASTHLPGESDHLVLRYSHTWLGWHATTIAQVKHFLRAGRFARADGA